MMDRFEEALGHAKITGQTPTEWLVSKNIAGVFYKDEKHNLTGGPELFGLPILAKPDLPLNKVVLRAGQNTVSTFNVEILIDLDAS